MSTIDFRGESNIREGLGITPVLGERVMIDPSAVVMGDVALGDDVSVWPHAAMRGDATTSPWSSKGPREYYGDVLLPRVC